MVRSGCDRPNQSHRLMPPPTFNIITKSRRRSAKLEINARFGGKQRPTANFSGDPKQRLLEVLSFIPSRNIVEIRVEYYEIQRPRVFPTDCNALAKREPRRARGRTAGNLRLPSFGVSSGNRKWPIVPSVELRRLPAQRILQCR
jgi:hypothetical protein